MILPVTIFLCAMFASHQVCFLAKISNNQYRFHIAVRGQPVSTLDTLHSTYNLKNIIKFKILKIMSLSSASQTMAEKSAADKSSADKVLEAIKALKILSESKELFGSVLNNIFDVLMKKLEAGHVGRNLYPMNAFMCISACFGLVKSFQWEVLDLENKAEKSIRDEMLLGKKNALEDVNSTVDDICRKIEELGKMLEEKIIMHDHDKLSDMYILFDLKFDLIGVDLESCTEKLLKIKRKLEKGLQSIDSYKARRESAAKAGGIAVLGSAASAAFATPSAISVLLPVIGACCTFGAVAAVGVLPLAGMAYIAHTLRREMAYVESVQKQHGQQNEKRANLEPEVEKMRKVMKVHAVGIAYNLHDGMAYAENVQGQYKQVDDKMGKMNNELETLKDTLKRYGNANRSMELRKKNELLEAQFLKDQQEFMELKSKPTNYENLNLTKA